MRDRSIGHVVRLLTAALLSLTAIAVVPPPDASADSPRIVTVRVKGSTGEELM